MVTLYDKELNDKPKYPKNPITKTTFLNSLFDYPSGIDCICTSISPIFENPMNDNKPSIIANIRILDYMPNCKAFEIGEDGQYVELLDELNRPQKVLTRINGQNQEVALNFNLKLSDEHADEYYIHKSSSFYPLIRYALVSNEVIPSNYHGNLSISYDEIAAYLPMLQFNATVERIAPKNFNPYNVLIAGKPQGQHDDVDDGFVRPPQSE